MITKLNKACQQYNVQELCDLFDHARSSYYYQSRDKPMDSKLMYIQPGKPTQNAYIERFNRTARQECINLHLFDSVESAQKHNHAVVMDL